MFRSPKIARTSSFPALVLFTLAAVWLCTAQELPTVRSVAVSPPGEAVEIEIQTSQRLTPQVQVLSGPDRIVVDFPGALPGPGLHSVVVQHGEVKAVRTGLFKARPPLTRVVLDLKTAHGYQVFPSGRAVIVKVGGTINMASGVARINPTPPASPPAKQAPPAPPAMQAPLPPPAMQAPPLSSPLIVGFQDGLLSIAAERANLAEVLYQVQVQTGAEIEVPSGAEQEKVSATLGPALASDVLAQLLYGSPYNLIILGSFEDSIDRVILTPKVPGIKVTQLAPVMPGSGVDPGQPPGQPEMKTPPPDQSPSPD